MRAKVALVAGLLLLAVSDARAWHQGYAASTGVAFFHNKTYQPVFQGAVPLSGYYAYPAAGYAAPPMSYYAAPGYSCSGGMAGSYYPSSYPSSSYYGAPYSYGAPAYYGAPGGCFGGSAGAYSYPAAGYGDQAAFLPIGTVLTTLDLIDRITQWAERKRPGGTDPGAKATDLEARMKEISKKLDDVKGLTSLPDDVKQLRKDLEAMEVNIKRDTRDSIKKAIDDLKADLKKKNPDLKVD